MTASSLNWRIIINLAVILLGVFSILPNFVKFPEGSIFQKSKLRYGLDIQGGTHLVMAVKIDEVIQEQLARLGESIQKQATEEGIVLTSMGPDPTNKGRLVADGSPEMLAKMRSMVETRFGTVNMNEENSKLILTAQDTYTAEKKKDTVEQAIESIRNRIDQFGVAEPSITAQGSDRILIQLPGIEDSQKAKDLINKTAKLDFLLVENSQLDLSSLIAEVEKAGSYSLGKDGLKYSDYIVKINADLATKLPPKTKILFGKMDNVETMELGKIPYLLRTDTDLGGNNLRDAAIRPGEFNEPGVAISFDPEGTRKFSDLTGANVGRLMAIVLDDVVYSAPVINDRIPGGEARISMGGRNYNQTLEEAKTITMALRAGALPAKLEQLEERTVGPSLGADSIAAGVKASYVGAIVIFIFMIAYYKAVGLVGNLGLMVNLVLLLAGLTMLEASLTLPGIAGIALTLGMAIDANVIVNERIKEELARGSSFSAAVREGYSKAFSAIFDSNLTTVATCFVLVYFGSGPVRGFGVTLIVGLVTSMFSAVFFTRTVLDVLIHKFKIQKLSI